MDKMEMDFEKAKNKALNFLSRRMHTEKELFDKLIRASFTEDVTKDVCEWASEYGFINDEEFARIYIADALNSKKYGIKRIRQALLHKGVSQYVIEDILCEIEIDEADVLLEPVRKKLGKDFDRKNIDKTIRHFATKGYEFSNIKRVIDILKDELGVGEDDEFET